MEPRIEVTQQPKIGDRDDFIADVIGPGDTRYRVPISITRTILSIWGGSSEVAAKELLKSIFRVRGTASAPPIEGFWFDSYNSGNTLEETASLISNQGVNAFTKESIDNKFVNQFGKGLFPIKEELDQFFLEKYKLTFFRSFEDAFEDSKAIEDLSTPPQDHANFIYRICVLSVFIDHFALRLSNEQTNTRSLNAFENWLTNETDNETASELVKPFRMVKKLRKQYPIHEEFEVTSGGRVIRAEIIEARTYYGLKDDYPHDWNSVVNDFMDALKAIMNKLIE